MEDKFASLLSRLEAVTTKLESGATATGAPPPPPAAAVVDVSDEVVPPSVKAFDDFLAGAVATFVTAAGKIDMPEVPSPRAVFFSLRLLTTRHFLPRARRLRSRLGW